MVEVVEVGDVVVWVYVDCIVDNVIVVLVEGVIVGIE